MARRASRRHHARAPALPTQQAPAGAKAPGQQRPQRRVGRAVPAPARPKSLPPVHLNAAGIDCGATEPFGAVPADRDPQPVRSVSTFTAALIALADWLEQCGIDPVALESTGVYWSPVSERLEARGVAVQRVEPGQLKMRAGRKTEGMDCQGIQPRHTFGRLSGALRPDEQIWVLRSYLRPRDMLVQYASPHIHPRQKALMQMNVHRHPVIDDSTGLTGMRVIEAILAGERDPQTRARRRHARGPHDAAPIARALEGHWREEPLLALQQAVALYRFSHAPLDEWDQRLQAYRPTVADQSPGEGLEARPRHRKLSNNEPRVDGRQSLFPLTGVDLMTIDGLRPGALAVDRSAELGRDMHPWPTEKHCCAWRCVGPGPKQTGGGGSVAARANTPAGRPGSFGWRPPRWRARRRRWERSLAGCRPGWGRPRP